MYMRLSDSIETFIKALLADIPADDTLRSGDLRRRISDL